MANAMMKSEREKMLAGELYDPLDPELARDRASAREHCRQLNLSGPGDVETRLRVIAALFGTMSDAWIEPPFYCDYGRNITLGKKVFFNFNCVVLDVMPVRIGNHTLFGPAVQIYTAMHPTDAEERRRGLEYAKAVTIGADVWVGGAAVICPGVTIGDRAIIGAGSVVTRDIPADSFAAGNPCRVIRAVERKVETGR
jgi:maltose O-acetyltransferase